MSIIIEVGVNTGSDTFPLLMGSPDSKYYGFEPTPELYPHLQKQFGSNLNVLFIPMAVSNKNGSARFNVAGQGDWGCSSLNQFSDNIHEVWENRSDFKFTHSYNVPTIRLDTFIENWNLKGEVIDFLWIDAQGHDMLVLESLGNNIRNVNKGRLEVAYTVELYKGTNNTLQNAETFLKNNGFHWKVTPDDVGKECNIEFWR